MTTETDATGASQAIANESRHLLEIARKLIRNELPKIGSLRLPEHTIRAFNADTRHVFAKLNWTPQIVHAECLRETVVSGLQEKCGTSAQRRAAVKRCEKAEGALGQEVPKIKATIAQLQSRQTDLEREVSEADAVVIRQENARKRLREYCPPEIQEEYRTQMYAIKLRKLDGERVSDNEIAEVEKLLDFYVS